MKRKLFGALIIFIGLALLAGLVYVIFIDEGAITKFLNRFSPDETEIIEKIDKEPSSQAKQNEPSDVKRIIMEDENVSDSSDDTSIIQEKSEKYISKDELMRMALSFVERFGSYSNQSNFSNIIDLKIFMSPRMQKWADNYISQYKRDDSANEIYYGMTTRSISGIIEEYDDRAGRAVIIVNTRRRESLGSTNNTSDIFNQDIKIDFIKVSGAWKVDDANWID